VFFFFDTIHTIDKRIPERTTDAISELNTLI